MDTTLPEVNKSPMILAIIGCIIGFIPVFGSVPGLILCAVAYAKGKRAMAEANARPDRRGITVAITGKWLGFGGIWQNVVNTAYGAFCFLLVLIAACG